MGKFNEIQEQVTQSFGSNSFTTKITDSTVEFDSARDSFTFKDEVNVPSMKMNGTETLPFTAEEKEKLATVTTPMNIKGRVDEASDLPTEGVKVGDVYLVGASGSDDFEEYICTELTGTPAEPVWENLGHVKTQANWAQTSTTANDYIKNKPELFRGDDNTSAGTCVVMIGNTASQGSSSSLVVGYSNAISAVASYNIVGGTGNTVQNGASNNLVSGYGVTVDGGSNNIVNGDSNQVTSGANQNTVNGTNNIITSGANHITASGYGNTVSGGSSYCLVNGSSNTVEATNNSIVSGTYNSVSAGVNNSMITGASNNVQDGTAFSVICGNGNTALWGPAQSIEYGASNVLTGVANLVGGIGNQAYSGSAGCTVIGGNNSSLRLTRTGSKTYTASGNYTRLNGARVYFGKINGVTCWQQIVNATYSSNTTTFTTDSDVVPESGNTFDVYFGNQVSGSYSFVEGTKNLDMSNGTANHTEGDSNIMRNGAYAVHLGGINNVVTDGTNTSGTKNAENVFVGSSAASTLAGGERVSLLSSYNSVITSYGTGNKISNSAVIAASNAQMTGIGSYNNAIIASSYNAQILTQAASNALIAAGGVKIDGTGTPCGNIVSGYENKLSANGASYNILSGYNNTLSGPGASFNIFSGAYNSTSSNGLYYSIVSGSNNTVDNFQKGIVSGAENTITGGEQSLIIGYHNTSAAQQSIITGSSNASNSFSSIVSGTSNTSNYSYNMLIGGEYATVNSGVRDAIVTGNRTKCSGSFSLVYGQYNVEDTAPANPSNYENGTSYSLGDKVRRNNSNYVCIVSSSSTSWVSSEWSIINSNQFNYVEIVGNGLTDTVRSNARTLDWDGNETLAGTLTIGGTSGATLKVDNGSLQVSFDGGTTWQTVTLS